MLYYYTFYFNIYYYLCYCMYIVTDKNHSPSTSLAFNGCCNLIYVHCTYYNVHVSPINILLCSNTNLLYPSRNQLKVVKTNHSYDVAITLRYGMEILLFYSMNKQMGLNKLIVCIINIYKK